MFDNINHIKLQVFLLIWGKNMADNKDIMDDNDFEKLLNDFINGDSVEEYSSNSDKNNIDAKKRQTEQQASSMLANDLLDADEKTFSKNYEYSEPKNAEDSPQTNDYDENQDLFAQAKSEYEEQEAEPMLGSDESELAQAFVNFSSSINNLSKAKLQKEFIPNFKIEILYPNYKPSSGLILSDDMVNGWLLLCKMYPQDVGTFPLKSTDEQFLNFAEKLSNQDLQLAVISYVEIMIDLEACELSYMAKLLRYQEKHIKKILYEEYLARKERQRKFVDAISAKNFPIDAELLVTNYFRVAQKDVDGAFKALTTNPAIFAPIDFKKLKPRFFGLIKVPPRDGIKMNIKIGNYLKSLKV